MVGINIKTKQYKKTSLSKVNFGHLLLVNNDLHLIGGLRSEHLIIQNKITKPLLLCSYSGQIVFANLISHRSIYLSKQQTIYISEGL